MYFDLYGSTQAIKLRGTVSVSRSHSPLPRGASSSTSAPKRVALPPLPTIIRRFILKGAVLIEMSKTFANSPFFNEFLRYADHYSMRESSLNRRGTKLLWCWREVRDEANGATLVPSFFDDDYGEESAHAGHGALPPRVAANEMMMRRTIDDLLADTNTGLPHPPALAPRLEPLFGRPSGATRELLSSSCSSFLPIPQNLSLTFTRARSAALSMDCKPCESGDVAQGSELDECTVCMSASVNSALYKCGHSCMCYDCAVQTYRSSGLCPLCRASILDVIKIFKA
ncbi:zinc finger, C3HC4 type [Cooperia oncophora]